MSTCAWRPAPEASGIFHVNDEADERVDDIVDSISRHVRTRIDIRHMPIEEARTKMGTYADALALDQIVRSPRARALGWSPTLHSVAGNVARLLEEFRTACEAAASVHVHRFSVRTLRRRTGNAQSNRNERTEQREPRSVNHIFTIVVVPQAHR